MERAGDLLGIPRDPAMRSTVLLLLSIAAYGFFLMRDGAAPPRPGGGRRWHNADSVLRTVCAPPVAPADVRRRAPGRPGSRGGHTDWRRAHW
jgi:hypothetical protein